MFIILYWNDLYISFDILLVILQIGVPAFVLIDGGKKRQFDVMLFKAIKNKEL